MLPLFLLVCVAYFILYAFAFSIPLGHHASQRLLQNTIQVEKTDLGPQSSLDAWIEQEEKIALQKLLDNVAPGGKNAKGAAPGTVIASPSHDSPDYYFQCMPIFFMRLLE
jgi:glucoamylase